jgi:hypothetical protein
VTTGHEDDRLARLLRATRADADPFLWTRVRARIEGRERVPRPLEWLVRPAALGVSAAVLVVALGVSWALLPMRATGESEDPTTVVEALLADANGPVDAAGLAWPDSGSWQ